MADQTAQITTVCECVDHCFAFTMWCDDFARYIDPEDMINGQDRAYEVVSDATRLHSFLALRKLDEFLSAKRSKDDDLIAKDLGIDLPTVIGDLDERFLTTEDRDKINKGVAHLTERLTLDADSEVDLHQILRRSLPALSRLLAALRKINRNQDNIQVLDRTAALIEREAGIEAQRLKDPHMPRP